MRCLPIAGSTIITQRFTDLIVGRQAAAAGSKESSESPSRHDLDDRRAGEIEPEQPQTGLVSRGGCITSALTNGSTVEVVGAVLGTVSSRAGRGLGTWRQGESLRLIARRLGKRRPSVQAFVLPTGGCDGSHRVATCGVSAWRNARRSGVAGGGCYQVFTETASGARGDRPVLEQVLDRLRPGDTLVVWKLDRLGMELTGMVDTPGLQQGRRPRDRATAA